MITTPQESEEETYHVTFGGLEKVVTKKSVDETSRPDATMRSLKVSLLGVHRRTPEQRAESKRIKFENVQASDDQAKKSTQSTKEGMISQDKGKKKVIYEPLVKLLEDKPYDLWDSFQAISGPKKGIVIRSSPPRSPPPPPPVHKSETVLGSKSKEPKRRVRQKRVAIPSNGTMISPQDVIDAGKNIYPAKKTHYAWFILAPSEEQNRKEPLRPLMEPNVEIKFDWNSHPTVSTLMKYIAMKLTLDSGEKVGIYMFGGLLSPEMKLVDVKNEWMAIVGSERETTSIGTSALHFCIQLTYA
ncbi:hypothetical protein L6452_26059 [Arctium lappa]|uniref:Uncharacterized protein n=1 Tax=Arctium lappa TaxID=4217 RepID=A0ACB9ACC6_ARCLA|nr:hypothetical protein L6452_26059 [Arctium lappa]